MKTSLFAMFIFYTLIPYKRDSSHRIEKKMRINKKTESRPRSVQILDAIFKGSVMKTITREMDHYNLNLEMDKDILIRASKSTRTLLNKIKKELSDALGIRISQEDVIILSVLTSRFLFKKLRG